MQPFLDEIAQKILERPSLNLATTCVVLPSRRACLYFNYYLSQRIEKPVMAPKVLSFNDFVATLSPTTVADRISLLFELHRCFSQQEPKMAELERFLPLGAIMLADFNMIDRNLGLADAKALFSYIEDTKAIERWAKELGTDEAELAGRMGENPRQFFDFWQKLSKTYQTFRESLLAKGLSYAALAYRKVYERLEELLEAQLVEHVFFAGFFQLTTVEQDIIRKLIKLNKASIYWDVDQGYVDDLKQEAGLYIRSYKRWLPPATSFYQGLVRRGGRKIRIISTNNRVAQAKVAGNLLKEHLLQVIGQGKAAQFKKGVNEVAILLPDEDLLLPVFYALPDMTPAAEAQGETFNIAEHVNVTMGISLKISPLFNLIDAIFELQAQAKNESGEVRYHHKALLSILKHPFLQVEQSMRSINTAVEQALFAQNQIYLGWKDFLNFADEAAQGEALGFYRLIFEHWQADFRNSLAFFYKLTERLHHMLAAHVFALEREFVLECFKTLKRLEDVLGKEQETVSIRTFRKFFYEMIQKNSVPFTGEPIGPIQIMGMLETRALDFKHVIVLSCNEGIMPPGKQQDSLIPFDLRSQANLPTYRENDASAAYTFYRLFHRAESLTFIYTDPAFTGDGKEKSRLLSQMLEEFAFDPKPDAPTITTDSLEVTQLKFSLNTQDRKEKLVQKDEQVLEMIRQKLQKGISPSAILAYLKNPVEFFYGSILKLPEEQEIAESMNAMDFGTIVHKLVEEMMEAYQGQEISAAHFQQMRKLKYLQNDDDFITHVKAMIGNMAQEVHALQNMNLSQGENLLQLKAAREVIRRFLEVQRQHAPFHLVMQERFLSHTFTVNGSQQVRLTGKADRIDICKNTLRILDYKTGTYDGKVLKISSLDELIAYPEKGKVLQLVLYRYILMQNLTTPSLRPLLKGFEGKVHSGFYFFRKWQTEFIDYNWEGEPENAEDFYEAVEHLLGRIVRHMLNPDIPFSENPPSADILA